MSSHSDPSAAGAVEEFVASLGPGRGFTMLAVWLGLWLALLTLSRYARRRAREGDTWWARWALLPIYEYTMIAKKMGIIGQIIGFGLIDSSYLHFFVACEDQGFFRAGVAIWALSDSFYTWTYALVMVVLWYKSAGTTTLHRAVAITVFATLATAVVQWGVTADYVAYAAHIFGNCTMSFPLGFNGSFLNAVEPDYAVNKNGWGVEFTYWWFLWLTVVLSIAAVVLVHRGSVQIRQPGLFWALVSLWTIVIIGNALQWPFEEKFGWYPVIVIGCIEAPFKYYIMLLDSRYWATLSPGSENTHCEIDTLEQPLMGDVAVELSRQRNSLSQIHPDHSPAIHIHWTQVEVGEIIGAGGAGKVYKGTFAQQQCAVKEIRCLDVDPIAVAEATYEVEISSLLAKSSRNIVRCFGFSIQPPFINVVMELCELGDLRGVLDTQRIAFQRRLEMGHDIISAVAHMHSMNLVHRDIKSLNFFVASEGVSSLISTSRRQSSTQAPMFVRLGDFGETALVPCNECIMMGTPRWMAPEIIQNTDPYTPAADCYSVSIVLWECLSTEVPFHEQGDDIHSYDLNLLVLDGLRPQLPISDGDGGVVGSALQSLVEECWQRDPEARPNAAQMLQRWH